MIQNGKFLLASICHQEAQRQKETRRRLFVLLPVFVPWRRSVNGCNQGSALMLGLIECHYQEWGTGNLRQKNLLV